MPTFSHWRLRFLKQASYVQLGEFALLDATGADVTTGGTPFSSSDYDTSSYDKTKAFDKNVSSEWCCAGNDVEPHIGYAHSSQVTPAAIRIRWSSSSGYLPAKWWLEANNGSGGWSAFDTVGLTPSAGLDLVGLFIDSYGHQIVRIPRLTSWDGVDFTNAPKVEKMRLATGPDTYFGGVGKVWGTVTKDNTPGAALPWRRKVVLMRQIDNALVAVTWSRASDGYWEFPNLDMAYGYYAVAFDHTGQHRMEGFDNLWPEVV